MFLRNTLQIICNKDTLALGGCAGFEDPEGVFAFLKFLLESVDFTGEGEGLWNEVEVFEAVEGLHSRNSLIHEVLPCYLITPRKMVDFVILQQLLVYVGFDHLCAPKN